MSACALTDKVEMAFSPTPNDSGWLISKPLVDQRQKKDLTAGPSVAYEHLSERLKQTCIGMAGVSSHSK
jgi:hypothetical protein